MSFVRRPYKDEGLKNFIPLTKDIGFLGNIKNNSVFGEIIERPEILDFFNYANIKAFRVGHWAYNHLHFSTQVPARVQYLVSSPINFQYDLWNKWSICTVAEDLSIFEKFNELEYIFVDCLVNRENIIYDGYFKDQRALIKGIITQMDNLDSKFPLDKEKIWNYAIEQDKSLSKFKPKEKNKEK